MKLQINKLTLVNKLGDGSDDKIHNKIKSLIIIT